MFRNDSKTRNGKLFFRYAIPSTISMLTAGVYTLVDGFFVGWGAGDTGLAAINVAFPLSLLIVACGEMIGTGGAVAIALARGRGIDRVADRIFGNMLVLLVPAALLLALLLPLPDPILIAAGAAPELLPAARTYVQITVGGGFFMMATVCLVAAMRNDGAPGLAMGIMVTYGSYMRKDNNLESSVRQIEIFDTGFAFLAGLMIIPAVFVFSGKDALQTGPGLMFVTLPKVFANMPLGGFVGAVFFLLVLFAALTSSISLMETIVSIICDKLHWARKRSALTVAVCALILGAPSSLGFGPLSFIKILNLSILDFMDFISNSVLMPIVAFLTCIFVGFFIKPKSIADEVRLSSPTFKSEKLFTVMIKWIAPIFLVAILLSSVFHWV